MKGATLHERSAPDDHRFFQRYAHDLPPSLDTLALPMSSQSTPITSPSIGSSLFLPSSSTSVYRSEFGPRSSACSPALGSSSSRSSNPRSRSTTDSTEAYPSVSRIPLKHSSSQRPSTAPHFPILSIPTNPADTSPDTHTRSHSRLAASIKSFLSRSTLASPSRFSLHSSLSYVETDPSSRSFHPLPPPARWPITSRKSRPPNLDISTSAPAAAMPSPTHAPIVDIHRRYASEAVTKIYYAKSGSGPPMSQDSLALSAQNVRERDPKTRNVLRRRPSGSAKLFNGLERGMSTSSGRGVDHLGPFPNATSDIPLTPAGAVAEAYKQQELFRDDNYYPLKPSIIDCMRTSHGSGYDRDHSLHSPTPSFISSAERRMQADQLAKGTSRAMPLHQQSASVSSNRHLTLKVSTKWQKVKGGVTSEESPARPRGHSKARPSLQEVGRNDKSVTHSTGRSMDTVLSTSDGAWSNPIEAHSRPGSEKGGPEGGKLWRLIQRISTGGLRDRFQTEKAVPPVPAIPKDLLDKANQGEPSNEPVSTLPHQPSSPRDKDHTSPATQNITSVAITSSSSNSSDVASIHFFHKTHSAHSSVSSYGEPVGPFHSNRNEISLDRHIIAPIEQLRLCEGHTEGDKPGGVPRPRRSASVPAALGTLERGEDEHVPLPSPRRPMTSGGSPLPACSRPPSTGPGSARASSLGGQQSQTADGLVSLSPPPRPARNARRGGSTASSPSHSLFVKQVDGIGARQLDRTLSAQSDTTARASPESRTSHDQDAQTHYTYRELGASRRPPLSEREKLDIWNDLLDRSDRAGGTLHIGGMAELLSDNLRFSMHSEV